MLHLKNSNYTPKDARIILMNSRDLSYGMNLIIRDCRVSSKFIELDVSVPKNNLELLLEKLVSIGKVDHSRHIIEEKIEKINNVTKISIEKVANKLLSSKPTISSIGPIKQLEYLDKIQNRLN